MNIFFCLFLASLVGLVHEASSKTGENNKMWKGKETNSVNIGTNTNSGEQKIVSGTNYEKNNNYANAGDICGSKTNMRDRYDNLNVKGHFSSSGDQKF